MAASRVATLDELTTGARKTSNGKVSVTDVIMVIKKCTRNNASKILRNLQEEQRIPALEMEVFGEANSALPNSGRGGNRLPEAAADARQIVLVIWALPGDSDFRRNSADVVARYIGGDPQMVREILANRAAQETLAREAPSHPARIFGEAVEAENPGVMAKRNSLDLLELDVREGVFSEKILVERVRRRQSDGRYELVAGKLLKIVGKRECRDMSSESEHFESAVLQTVFLQMLAGLFQDPVNVATMVLPFSYDSRK